MQRSIHKTMRFARCVFLPSSLMYLVFNIGSTISTVEVNMAFYLCVLMIMLIVGKIYGDRIVEVIDQPIVLFLLPCLYLAYQWSIRRGSMVKHATTTAAKPSKPKTKPPKESGLNSNVSKVLPAKKKSKKKKMYPASKENIDPRQDSPRNIILPVLTQYRDLQNLLRGKDLYGEFEKHLLTPEQLRKNDYPVEDPARPGHIVQNMREYHPSPTSRICSRCGELYFIENNVYRGDSNCFFHLEKKNSTTGRYGCCKFEVGCQVWPNHVNPTLPLDDIVFKKTETKKQVRPEQLRRVYALDCEMVYTTIGFEVAKVTLVDEQGKPVYDSLVLPSHPIVDYNTIFSGIKKTDLLQVKVTLEDVQAFLLKTITKDTILVGHALQNDLRCLRIIHGTVVDTQVVFRSLGDNRRQKLKTLAQDFLGKSIQDKQSGHCSLEDSRACMELMLQKILGDLGNVHRPHMPHVRKPTLPTQPPPVPVTEPNVLLTAQPRPYFAIITRPSPYQHFVTPLCEIPQTFHVPLKNSHYRHSYSTYHH